MRRPKGGGIDPVLHALAALLLQLLALVALLPQQALAVAPTVTWGAFTTGGTYSYKWTLTELLVNNIPAPGPSNIRLDKGSKQNVPYQLAYTRTLDQSSAKLTVSGSVTITNANTGTEKLTVASVTLSLTPIGGVPTSAPIKCDNLNSHLPPGGAVFCRITNAPYSGFSADGNALLTTGGAMVSIAFTDRATPPAPSPITSTSPTTFSFENVQGNFATATLTNTFDLSPLDELYAGFSGFVRQSVWRILDPGTEIPATTGVTVKESGTKDFTYVAGGFVVCTSTNGVSLTNTATLTPQLTTTSPLAGVPITVTGTVSVQVAGCYTAPDVTFQILQTWAAQSFSWSLTKTAQQSAFTVDQNVGSVPMGYTLRAVAQPTTGSYYVAGKVFVNNNRPGILNIARIGVQLSTGQQAVLKCMLTAPYVAADGLVWGAANAGGSVTQNPCIASSIDDITPSSIVAGTFASTCTFVIPEFASALCAFNMSLGTSPPGEAIQIMPQLSWGDGGRFVLDKPPQQTLNFAPADNFYPVGNCISLADTAQALGSSITLSNGLPSNQQVCVEGKVQPFQQPAPISYTVTATVNPSTTPDCQPNGTKTYSITSRATATPIGTGAPVAAQAEPAVTLTVNCAKPSVAPTTPATPPMTAMTPAPASKAANLNVVVGGLQTIIAGAHTWTVTKRAVVGVVQVRAGGLPAKVPYTVTVTKSAAVVSQYHVIGTITITNLGTKPVDLSLVSVIATADNSTQPATCPPDAKQALPSAAVVCTFNVTWNTGANSGSLGARVDTPKASFYGAPAAFDFTNPRRGGTRGLTANVYDDLSGTAPPNATGVPTVWFTPDGDAPPPKSKGLPLTTGSSRTYKYTVQVGPFADKGSCGSYRLGNIATVEPSDGSSPAGSKEAVVSISVTGCGTDTTLQSLGAGGSSDLKVAVTKVTAARLASHTWAVNGTATPPALSLQYDQTAPAEFALMVRKLPSASYEVSGTVTVTNTNPSAAAQLAGLTVAMEPRGGGAAETVDAVCGAQGTSFTIAPGSTVTCSFTRTVEAGATPGGQAKAIATDGRNLQAESAPAPYNLGAAAATAADGAQSCAQVTAGLVVGTAVWKADGTNAGAGTQTRVCNSSKLIKVPVTVGPLAPTQCGASKIYALASVVPLNGGGGAAAPVEAMVPLPVTVTGCPKHAPGATHLRVHAAPPKPEVQETYKWTAKLMSDANGGPVKVRPGAPAKVTFLADSERAPVMRSLSLSGKVTLEALSAAPLTVASAHVAIYDGRERYTLVPLTCPFATAPGGPIELYFKGAPILCIYAATGLAVNGGAVLPVVIASAGGAPAPAHPVAYSLKGAPRNIVGACANASTELVLREAGPTGKRAKWQPSVAGKLGSVFDCEGGKKQRFVLNFGGDAAAAPPACGNYVFKGALTLVPNNGDSVEGTETFPVKVAC